MKDYKELIDILKNGQPHVILDYSEDFANAIETLFAERNAAIEELRGLCWCCKHGKKWDKAPAWSNMTTCDYMKESGALACSGRKHDCKYWEFRGLRKQQEEEHV